MRSLLLALAVTFLLGGTLVSAQRVETVRIQVNHQKNVARGRINVRFVKMVEDSRCPRDVQCIQAGNAEIRVRVSRGKRADVLTLNTDTRKETPTFEGYEFRLLALTPEPRSNIRINPSGYVATIEIRRR
jgi:hypothetical protein